MRLKGARISTAILTVYPPYTRGQGVSKQASFNVSTFLCEIIFNFELAQSSLNV